MSDSNDEQTLVLGDLDSPEAIRAHVEWLARHVPMTAGQMDALAADPAALRQKITALKNHQMMTDQQMARTVSDPEALRQKLADLEADAGISAEEKEALRLEYTWILKHLDP